MRVIAFATSVLLLGCASASGLFGAGNGQPPFRIDDIESASGDLHKRHDDWHITEGVFEQLIDHSNHSAGYFKQRFWWSSDYWGGQGAPVILFTPGQDAGNDYLGYTSNYTLTGMYAQAVRGAVVILEPRYYGDSSPFTVLSTANLTYLTLQNMISDITHFASNVQLPFDPHRTSAPNLAPWIFYGCSFSGALVAWTSVLAPGTFWAYHASCAPVELVSDFWQYDDAVRNIMPQNCSTDVVKVVDHIDQVLTTGTDEERHALKKSFGLADLASDDFAQTLQTGPDSVQYSSLAANSTFYKWCDYVENAWPGSNNAVPGAEGVGLEKALAGYAKWSRELSIPDTCESYGYPDFNGTDNVKCFDTHNLTSPLYTDLSVNNTANRQLAWVFCDWPVELWRTGAPKGIPSILPRLVDVEYFRNQCAIMFPPENGVTYGIAAGRSAADVNAITGGWNNVKTKRILWSNGELDPVRPLTVSSYSRPGGPLVSTKDAPVIIVPRGVHCRDALASSGDKDPDVKKVQQEEVAIIKGWVEEFYSG